MPCSYWNLVLFFNQRTIDAMVKCTRISLDFIKRYVQASSKYMSDLSHEHAKLPLFKVGFGERGFVTMIMIVITITIMIMIIIIPIIIIPIIIIVI